MIAETVLISSTTCVSVCLGSVTLSPDSNNTVMSFRYIMLPYSTLGACTVPVASTLLRFSNALTPIVFIAVTSPTSLNNSNSVRLVTLA